MSNYSEQLDNIVEVASDTATVRVGADILKRLNQLLKQVNNDQVVNFQGKSFDYKEGYLQAIVDASSAVTSAVDEKHSVKGTIVTMSN